MSTATLIDPPVLTQDQTELVTLAGQISAWQDRTNPRISNEEMVRQYPGLGSTKTYRKLAAGTLDSLLAETHLPKYRGVWSQIEELTGSNGREEIYEDLTPTYEARLAAAGLKPQRGRERLLLIEGPTGSGKTTAIQSIAGKYAGSFLYVEADESWKNPNHMIGQILVAAGVFTGIHDDKMPTGLGGRMALLIAWLNSGRKTLGIDEGHHLTAPGLNLIKAILNQTDSTVIIGCIDTLWRKLAAKHWEEAKQLVFNRLYERVRLAPPTPADAELFLGRRVPAFPVEVLRKTSGEIAEAAKSYGFFSFLRRLSNQLNAHREEITVPTVITLLKSLTEGLKTR